MNFEWGDLQNGSDIRGIALPGVKGETVNLTEERIYRIALAFSRWLEEKYKLENEKPVVSVGCDSRLTGPTFKDAFIKGLKENGCRVYDFGMASTPAMFMSTIFEGTRCHGAVMLTASHLPFNRNGIKFFVPEGGLEKPDISEILKIAADVGLLSPQLKGSGKRIDFISIYADQLVNMIRQNTGTGKDNLQPLKGHKILVDAGNGAGGFFVDKILKPLGADVSGSIFLEPNGYFPNHSPNPEDEKAMSTLKSEVLKNNANLGIIFDTDVDRAALVDQDRKSLHRNRLIAIMAAIVLEEHPGTYIVTDSITSEGLTEFIENKSGGHHHRFKRGYRNVINEAKRLNNEGKECWLAAETSGHIALKENFFLDDGAYLIAKILVRYVKLAQQGKTLDSLINNLREPLESKEFRIKFTSGKYKEPGERVIRDLHEYAGKVTNWEVVENNYEGVRVTCKGNNGNSWFLLRQSLHDPVLPLNIESEELGGIRKITDELSNFFRSYLFLESPPWS